MIVSEYIIWMRDPEACWALIGIKKGERGLGTNCKIPDQSIFGFCCIFNKEGVTHCVISYISLNCQIVDSMQCACSIVGMMDGIVFDVGFCNSADHMEMKRISSKLECLTDLSELNILNSTFNRLVSR